jgi:hypothetical protein
MRNPPYSELISSSHFDFPKGVYGLDTSINSYDALFDESLASTFGLPTTSASIVIDDRSDIPLITSPAAHALSIDQRFPTMSKSTLSSTSFVSGNDATFVVNNQKPQYFLRCLCLLTTAGAPERKILIVN